ETPTLGEESEDSGDHARVCAEAIGATARGSGRSILTELESKQILAAYGVPTVPTTAARDPASAAAAADAIGYPVALKLHSESITRKPDVGSVQLCLASPDAVRRAFSVIETSVREHAGPGHFLGVTVQPMIRREGYELIVGSSLDAQFGPILLFGAGGQLVEV